MSPLIPLESALPVSGSGVLVLGVIGVVCLVAVKICQAFVFSPLRGIPGPWYAAITQYWLILRDLGGQRTKTIHRLHQKYGPVVRVGPNELSLSSRSVIKELYGQTSTYIKAPIYDAFLPGLFRLQDREEHRVRRRYLSNVFAMNHLQTVEPVIQDNVVQLIEGIDNNGGRVNVADWFKMFSLDVVAELSFGTHLQAMQSGVLPQFAHDVDSVLVVRMLEYTFPIVATMLRMWPRASMRHFLESKERIEEYGVRSLQLYIEQNGRTPNRRDLLSRLITAATNGDIDLRDLDLAEECSSFIFAGTDTTSTTLVYLFWELSQRPEWQDRIRAEITELDSSEPNAPPEWKTVVNLQVLDAVIKEALRLHTAAPASLWRVVPKGGRVLDGYFIPENTIVSMQAYTTHRDPEIWDRPAEFDPSRWLPKDCVTEAMNEMFMPYSKGTRACIGLNLANMELRIATAALLKFFRVRLAEGPRADDMEMVDHFIIAPKGRKCNLVFERLVKN